MQHYPIFLSLEGARVLFSGGGQVTLAKLRLLMKTGAALEVYAPSPHADVVALAEAGALTLHRRMLDLRDAYGAKLIYGGDENAALDARLRKIATKADVLCNIVDNLESSDFITPAIVDRDPVTVAIGTEGAAPVLARQIKEELEARLPSNLGVLARAAAKFRKAAEVLPVGRARRNFWAAFFADDNTAAPEARLQALLKTHQAAAPLRGSYTLTAAPSADPELLTLKARRALDGADVVIHDALIAPEVLELARREARFVRLDQADTPHLARLMQTHAAKGHAVLFLSAEAPAPALLRALAATGFDTTHIPGLLDLPAPTPLKEHA